MSTKFTGWHTARELADMKLPCLPGTRQGVQLAAERDGWQARKRSASGGGLEYSVAGLPEAARNAYWKKSSGAAVAALPEKVSGTLQHMPVTNVNQLQDGQREAAEARLVLLNELERLAATMGVTQAGTLLCQMADAPPSDWPLVEVVKTANERTNGDRTLHIRSLYRWRKAYLADGFIGLAPKYKPVDNTPRWWHAPLLALYGRPQKPSLIWAHAELVRTAPAGVKLPSYDQTRRLLLKMSVLEVNKGRDGKSAMRARMPFVRRDTSKMLPADFYVADGHTFDAEIAHPAHGRPFRPEITSVIDGATRMCVGFSIGLSESSFVVIDAVRYAAEKWAIPAILYTDRGTGYNNHRLGDPDVGILARIGVTQRLGLARNPQAHGIVEISHRTLWVDGAKEFDTFVNKVMDGDAKMMAFRRVRRDIKATGASPLLMPFRAFVQWCEKRVDWYNNRPHRALPLWASTDGGKKRHMTPLEMWHRGIAAGADLHKLSGDELDDAFRPYLPCLPVRGEIRLYGNTYYHADLAHYDPKVRLRVGYDLHDASRVWVRDPNGRLICVAQLDGNKRDFFPLSVIEQAAEKRTKLRLARLEIKAQEARDELHPPALLEHQEPNVIELSLSRIEAALAQPLDADDDVSAAEDELAPDQRPIWKTDFEKYEWLREVPDLWTDDEAFWVSQFRDGDDYASLYAVRERSAVEALKAREHFEKLETEQQKAAVAVGNGGFYEANSMTDVPPAKATLQSPGEL